MFLVLVMAMVGRDRGLSCVSLLKMQRDRGEERSLERSEY